MPDCIFSNDRIRLTQSKTGALIDVPMTPHRKNSIEEIRERKRQIESLESLVIYEGTGQPYKGNLFNKKFSLVRQETAKHLPDIVERKFLDLSDTAVARLAMAGNIILQICAVTGHQEKTAHQIMCHYFALNKDMADVAIDKLTIWMKKEGIEI